MQSNTAEASAVEPFLSRALGSWVGEGMVLEPEDGGIDVLDPARDVLIAQVAAAGVAGVDAAVATARASFADGRWHGQAPERRQAVLWRFAELLERESTVLTRLEVLDNGMPLGFAEWELSACCSWLRHFAGETTRLFGRNASAAMSGGGREVHAYSASQPLGVVALIVPWNAPAGNMMIKLAPALAAGNSCVIKPAEETPLVALRIAELALEAGVPPGVVNVVIGRGAVAGQALADHGDVDKVSFTGSTETGKAIVRASAGNLKRVTLELGGKSPVVVLDDADIEAAIPQVAMGIFANSGQVCFAGSRLYAHEAIFDRLMDGLAAFAGQLKVGSGFDPETVLGPLISRRQHDRVCGFMERGKREGAQLVTGGGAAPGAGYFVEPTIFANVGRDMGIVREEIFGPVLVATPFSDIDEVIRQANDSRYGLGAGIFSRDVGKVHRMAARLDAGNVWVNCYGITHPALPFGGFKESGWGREMGSEVMAAFTETKSVVIKLD